MDRHSNHGRSAVVDEVGAGGGGDVGGEGVGGANTFFRQHETNCGKVCIWLRSHTQAWVEYLACMLLRVSPPPTLAPLARLSAQD